ncbi:MAG: tRNA 2-thiouridine(34) synthase MnmA [Nitrospirales bacterium]|nr:tRNA 2-thiouridine(34) synthase MnmA [Nitrospirales bacterium]
MPKPTVILGMSGGVDSSVAASYLLNEGYDVHGITLKTWEDEDDTTQTSKRWQERGCCKVGMAKYVAKLLDISHEVIDIREMFTKEVIDDFVAGYLQGITPNPCVRCNERVKVLVLHKIAMERGANFFATGHYAQITQEESPKLLKGKDGRKDQSYFLYRLSPTWLSHMLLPLGGMEKSEVWQRAEAMGLPTDELKESQEICFVTRGNYRTFLTEHAPHASRPGPFLDAQGQKVGEHRGIAFYTPGQRKGLGLATGDRLYVQTVIPDTHTVVLGPKEGLLKNECLVADLNIFDEHQLQDGNPIDVKFRYASPSVPAHLHWKDQREIQVQFDTPQQALSPGQSMVFYRNDQVLGGGLIQRFPLDTIEHLN